MKRYRPLSCAGLDFPRSSLAIAALCGLAAQPARAELLVNLDATTLSEGPLVDWPNTASLPGAFTSSDSANPPVVARVAGMKGVQLTGAAHYLGPVAPTPLTGAGARTIEAWVHNPAGSDFETIVAWGRRGGPDNTNSAFSHGVHPTWGAFGGWGAADLDWQEKLAFGRWNYVVYTYDGTTSAAYADGELANSEEVPLDTFATDTAGNGLPFRVGAANNADGTVFNGEPPTFTLAVVRVHDTVLTADQIRAKFDSEKSTFGLLDTDGDQMPDYFERSYAFLSETDPTDAAKDQDGDGLSNLREFEVNTNPGNADTDGDTVSDGAELNRQFGGAAAPTDPLKADTDADGASDGVETGTGVFVSATNLGSNPLVADTDGDTFTDGQEAAAGSDPNKATSVPPPKPVVDLNAKDLALGVITAWPSTGAIGGSFAASGTPTVTETQTVKGVTLNGTSDFLTGPAVPTYLGGNNNRTVEAWVFNPSAADEETIFSWGRRGGPDGSNVSFNHGLNASFGAVGHWGGPDIGWNNVGPYTGRWTHVAYVWDSATLTTTVYADGQEANTETLVNPLNTHLTSSSGSALPFRVGSQNEANGSATTGLRGSMTIARILVHDRVLSATDIAASYTAGAGDFGLIDFDNDGLPTWLERQNPSFLNPNDASDAAKDQDSDGLTNLEEYQNQTSLTVADTDGDGLNDGAEVKRTPSPTNPLRADTDQDGLVDGAETATDPVSSDTDADTFPDGQEVFHGSNPNLASSVPDLTKPQKLVDLSAASLPEGPLNAWPDSGKLGRPFVAGATPSVVGPVNNIKAVTLDGTQHYVGPSAPIFIGGDAGRTVDAWIFNPAANTEETIVAWGRRGGAPDGSNASYTHGTDPTWGAMGQWGPPDTGWNGKVVQGVWTHVAFVYDPAKAATFVYSDGVEANTKAMPGPLAIHNTDTSDRPLPIRVGAQNGAGGAVDGQFGTLSIARLRIYDGVLSGPEIAALYDAEKATYTAIPLEFLAPQYDRAADRLTLSWTAAGASYTLEGVNSLDGTWAPVATGLTATSYVVEGVSTKPNTLYRVRTQ